MPYPLPIIKAGLARDSITEYPIKYAYSFIAIYSGLVWLSFSANSCGLFIQTQHDWKCQSNFW